MDQNQMISSKGGDFHQMEFTKENADDLVKQENEAWRKREEAYKSGDMQLGWKLTLEWKAISLEAAKRYSEYPHLFFGTTLWE